MLFPSPKHRIRRPQNLLAACLLAAAFPLATSAQTRSFIDGDNSNPDTTTYNFGTATNWNPNGVPGATANDILTVGDTVFSGLTGDLHVTINGLFGTSNTITSLTFDSGALPQALVLTETGGTIQATTETLGNVAFGNTFNQGSGSGNIAATLNLGLTAASFDNFYNLNGAGTSLTVTSNLNIGGGGVGTLTQNTGTTVSIHSSTADSRLILAGNSNSTGTYNLNGGSLTIDDFEIAGGGNGIFNQSGGSLNVDAVTFFFANSGQTATYNYSGGTATFNGGLIVGSLGIFNLQAGGSLPFNLTVASGGTFNFAGGTLGTGNITLNSGTLQLLGHSITFSSHIQGTGTIQNGSATTATTLTLSPATTGTFAGIIADGSTAPMSVTLSTGTFTLSGSNTYSGGTNIVFPATLKAGKTNAFSPNSTFFFSGILDLNGFDQTIGGLSGASGSVNMGSSNLTVAQSSTTSYQNPLNGSGTFTKSSTGTLTLTDVFPFTGGFSVTGGTLAISNTISASSYSASNGGTLQLAFPVTLAPGVMNATGGNITFTGGFSPTIGDTSGSPATVTIGTAGTFTTSTGNTSINATGTINLTGGTLNANGDISVTGGALTQTGGTFTWAGSHAMTIQSAGKVSLVNSFTTPTSATITVTGSGSKLSESTSGTALQINNGTTLNVNTAGSVSSNFFCVASNFNSTVGGTGDGTVTVDGAGSSLVGNAGQCYLGTGGVGNLTFSGGATGSFLGFFIGTFLTAGGNGTLTVEGNATVTSTSLIRVAAAATSGTGAINVTGGTLTQTAASPIFIGAASLSTGTVTIGTAGTFTTGTGTITIGKTGTLTLQSGGTLNVNGNLTSAGTVTLSGTQAWAASTSFTNTAGTATFTTDPGTASVAHLSLSINAGTVLLAGNQHFASVTLNGGTLGGYAVVRGTLTLGSSALTIAPSATLPSTSIGTLQLNNLSTNANTTLAFNLKTPNLLTGGADQIIVANFQGLTLNGGTIAITGSSTGTSSLGYYKAILYISTLLGTGITSITMPPITNNIAYTLDTQHDPGFVDIHRGYLGDANDDGIVNIDDYLRIDAAFLHQTPNPTWLNGDFNADGTVNFKDYAYIDFASQHPTGVLADGTLAADEIALHTAEFGAPYTDTLAALNATPIPEPASLAFFLTFLPALLTRRRGRCAWQIIR